MVTDAIPYIESGRLKGILAGMPAAEYEKLVYDYMILEQNSNNKYIVSDVMVERGKRIQECQPNRLHIF